MTSLQATTHDAPNDGDFVMHKLVTPFDPPETIDEDPQRRRLIAEVQQDRVELVNAAERLMEPVQALQNAKEVLVMTGRALPWLALAGNVIAIAVYLRKRQRPPITLLLGLSVQIFKAISASRAAAPSPAPLALSGGPEAARPGAALAGP